MADNVFRFEGFELDARDRSLRSEGQTVELNARYLDALILLVGQAGRLVSKDRFLDEVWRGVPVTDEALTQCIRSLRKALGDDAARPRFIETVPKHGYRFVAPVATGGEAAAPAVATPTPAPSIGGADRDLFFRLGRAGMLGGGAAGAIGGAIYGLAGVADPEGGSGGVSALLVVAVLTLMVGLLGGAGVAFGAAAAGFAKGGRAVWTIAGGALGGMIVGGAVKLVGLDAFTLLFGQSPGGITGGVEGLALGAGVGLGVALAGDGSSPRRAALFGGVATGLAGVLVALGGGRLMGGSLALLAERFPQSRLRIDHLGGLFGEAGFGPISQAVTAGLEGLLFGACVVAAMAWARREAARRT